MSVNLSATSLTVPDLAPWILSELQERQLRRSSLTVEVTETAAIDLLQAVKLLRPLHDRGVRVSIDDFGTGYTSLAALPDLPLDELKVDQRFVLRSSTSPADETIVRTLTSLPRLKSWDSRLLMRRPVGFAFHRAPDGVSLHAL